jgi:hypothetical protein
MWHAAYMPASPWQAEQEINPHGSRGWASYQLTLRLRGSPLHITIAELAARQQRGDALEVGFAQCPRDWLCRNLNLRELLVRKRHHVQLSCPDTNH